MTFDLFRIRHWVAAGLLLVAHISLSISLQAQSITAGDSGLVATDAAGNAFTLGVDASTLTEPVYGLLEDAVNELAAGASIQANSSEIGMELTWDTTVGSDEVEGLLVLVGAPSDDWADNSGVIFALLFPNGEESPRSLIQSIDADQAAWNTFRDALNDELTESNAKPIHSGLLSTSFAVDTPMIAISSIAQPATFSMNDSAGTEHSFEVDQGINFSATLSGNAKSIEASLNSVGSDCEALEVAAGIGAGFLSGLTTAMGTVRVHAVVAATDVVDEALSDSRLSLSFPVAQPLFQESLQLPGDSSYELGLKVEELTLDASVSEWGAGMTLVLTDDDDKIDLTGGIGIEIDADASPGSQLKYVWEFAMGTDGVWSEPFAIPGLELRDAELGFDYDPSKGGSLLTAIENFAFEGSAKLGKSEGTLALMKSTDDETGAADFGVRATLNTLTLKDLVGLAYPSKKKHVPNSIAKMGLSDVAILLSTAPDIDFTGNAAAAVFQDGEQGDLEIGQGFEVTGTYAASDEVRVTYSTRAGINGGSASGKLKYGFELSASMDGLLDDIADELKSPLAEITAELGSKASDVLEFRIDKLSGSVEAEIEDLDGKAKASFSAKSHLKFDPSKIGSGAFDAVGIKPIGFGGVDEDVDIAFQVRMDLDLDPSEYAEFVAKETWRAVSDAVPVQQTLSKVKDVADKVAEQAEAIGEGFAEFFALVAESLEAVITGQFVGSNKTVEKVTDTNLDESKLERIDVATAILQQGRSLRRQERAFRDQLGLPESYKASHLAAIPAADSHTLALMGQALRNAEQTFSAAEEAGAAAPQYWIKVIKETTTQHDFIGIPIGEENSKSTKKTDYDPGNKIKKQAESRRESTEALLDLVRNELGARSADDPELLIDGTESAGELAERAMSRAWSTRTAAETYHPIEEMFVIVKTAGGDSAGSKRPVNLLIEEVGGHQTRIPLDSSGNDFDKSRYSMFWLGPDAVGHLLPERIKKAGFENPFKDTWACDQFWIFFKTKTGRYRYESPWKSLIYRDEWFKVGVDYQNDTDKSRLWSTADRQEGCRKDDLYDKYFVFATVSTREKSGGDQPIRLSDGAHSNKLERANGSTSLSRGWTYRLRFKNDSAAKNFLTELDPGAPMELQAGGKDGIRLIHAVVVGTDTDQDRWDVLGVLANNSIALASDEGDYKMQRKLTFNRYRFTAEGIDSKEPIAGLIKD